MLERPRGRPTTCQVLSCLLPAHYLLSSLRDPCVWGCHFSLRKQVEEPLATTNTIQGREPRSLAQSLCSFHCATLGTGL